MQSEISTINPLRKLFVHVPYHEFFGSLADSIDDPLLVISADTDEIILANHAFLLLSGFSRSEIDGLFAGELFELDHQNFSDVIERRAGRVRITEDIQLRTRGESLISVDVESRPASRKGAWTQIFIRKSQDRHVHQSHRSASEARLNMLQQVAEILLNGSFESHETALQVASTLLSSSAIGMYRVSANAPEYVLDGELPKTFPQKISSADFGDASKSGSWEIGDRTKSELHRAARAAKWEAVKVCPVGEKNAWIGLLLAGWEDQEDVPPDAIELLRMIAYMLDGSIRLKLRHATIAELQKQSTQFESEIEQLFSRVDSALLRLDEDLNILRSNPAADTLLGFDQDEIVGLSVKDVLIGPEDITALMLDSLAHERISSRPRLTVHKRDGTPIPVQFKVVPVDSEGVKGLLLVLRDLSEEKAIEAQAEFLEQRALLGEVTAIFAHEVRNPINNISTGVQLVASRLGEDHPQYDPLLRVKKECDRLDQLMSDVLFYARPLELRMQQLDVEKLLESILQRWAPRFDLGHITVHRSFDDDSPPIDGDPRTLEQVLVNLITNGVQAMGEDGGTLSFTLRPGTSTIGKTLELILADTGPGIPQDRIDRVFDPFYTTKKDGTGLGLAITRRIISAHKGSIRVESFPDAGTVFEIQIPAVSIRNANGGGGL